MGYQTRYEFTCIAPDDKATAFTGVLNEIRGGEHDEAEPCTWYEHDAEIGEAMMCSGVDVVDLHGEGEEQGDVWDKEFRVVDGKVMVKTFEYQLVRNTEPS